ncbi:MAG: PilZ domain-containing protein [Chlamydiae bacterium]|nr:PilZ domain-containing protein [Chlamydiota bacterium]MBI3266884.1 PilZ domain-containing protein [Chlamydiota bacterium]
MALFVNKKDAVDRRRKDRVGFHVPMKLWISSRISHSNEETFEVIGKNISEGGILIQSSQNFPPLSPCRLRMQTAFKPEGLWLEGMIVWTQQNEEDGMWKIGIAFVNLGKEARVVLRKIVA